MLCDPHQLLGGREDVSLLCREVWRGSRSPLPAPRAGGGAAKDAGPYPKVWKALTRREVRKGGPLVQDALSGELLSP